MSSKSEKALKVSKAKHRVILAGIGGQGILFVTRLLTEAAILKRYNVLGSETHGMAQRGGSVISHLKIGQARSPLVRMGTADLLLAFDQNESYRNLGYLRKGGVGFINTTSPKDLSRKELNTPTLPSSLKGGVPPLTGLGGGEKGKFLNEELYPYIKRMALELYCLDATSLALEAGIPLAANLVLLGFAAASSLLPFSSKELEEVISRATPSRFSATNQKAFSLGNAQWEGYAAV